MTTAPVYQVAKRLGNMVVGERSTLPLLAMTAVAAVAAGEVEADDAERIYSVYFDAKVKRSPSQNPNSRRVQVSKLRQIMLLGDRFGREGLRILSRTSKIHAQLAREKKVMPLYPAMVEVARHCLGNDAHTCTEEVIIKVLSQRKRR